MTLEQMAADVANARRAVNQAREALIDAESRTEGVKEAKRALRKSILARDKAQDALREKMGANPAGMEALIGSADPDAADILTTDIVAPEPGESTPQSEWEERMSNQRSNWRAQDNAKYINPEYDPELDVTWHIYMWQGPKKGWKKVGYNRKKPGRRKPMTMNRLFANIRQKFQIASEVPVKLISQQDDEQRIAKKLMLAPPERKKGNRPDEPLPESLVTPGLRDPKDKPPVRVIKGQPVPKKKAAPAAKAAPAKKPAGDKIRFATWGAMHGKTYFLGASKAARKVDAKHEAQAAFAGHVGLKTVAIADMPYAVRNEIVDAVAGVTEMEAP